MASDQQQQTEPDLGSTSTASIPPRALPDRNIAPETFEDAYISFILYCNPALPQDCDIDALRDAFKIPPKSQGKEFSPWHVFENVKKFYNKEIQTWTEMVIQLGVEPPDLSKDESSQKLTQYGVRLKRWLQSYHVKPFFEYLMGIDNEYWTDIPNGPDPTSAFAIRDGVHVEDDMALRALLPHIRPKRGRKRPMDQEVSTPLSARPIVFASPWRPAGTPLSAHPGNAPTIGQPLLAPNDGSHTPLSRYPNSAITPTTRSGLWDSPSTPQRRLGGAKGVSSAWKVAGQDNGKTRGRPPMDRTPIDGPGQAFSAWPGTKPSPPSRKRQKNQISDTTTTNGAAASQPPVSTGQPAMAPLAPIAPMAATPPPTLDRTASAPVPAPRSWSQSDGSRPARPSISLQVPQRAGGNVRLATPPPPTAPPAVMVNGEHRNQPPPQPAPPQPVQTQEQPLSCVNSQPYEHPSTHLPENAYYDSNKEPTTTQDAGTYIPPLNGSDIEDYYFEKIPERTNVDSLLAFFLRATQDGQWFDHTGAPTEPASMEEAAAINNCTLQEMLRTAVSPQAFLINLGAMAGARSLMTTRPKYYRMPDGEGCSNYKFEWEYRFGHLKGHFNMTQSVPWTMWKKPAATETAVPEGESEVGMSAEEWKGKYQSLLREMKKREQELTDLRGKVMTSLMEDLN